MENRRYVAQIDDIAGFCVVLELNDEQDHVYRKLARNFIIKKFNLTDPKIIQKWVEQLHGVDNQGLLQEFLSTDEIKEFLLDTQTNPIKRTKYYLPWYAADVILFMEYFLIPYQDIKNVLEFAGGNSSIWFAKRVESVITVETSEKWRRAIQNWMMKEQLTNLVIVDSVEKVPIKSYDLVIIDSDVKKQCVVEAMWADNSGSRFIAVDNIHDFITLKGVKGEGSGRLANQWLLENNWEVYTSFKDTCFYMRKE